MSMNSSMKKMLRDAQKMQREIEAKQKELAETEYEITKGGGVTVIFPAPQAHMISRTTRDTRGLAKMPINRNNHKRRPAAPAMTATTMTPIIHPKI